MTLQNSSRTPKVAFPQGRRFQTLHLLKIPEPEDCIMDTETESTRHSALSISSHFYYNVFPRDNFLLQGKSALDQETANSTIFRYLLPNDGQEQDRLDLQHIIWTQIMGGDLAWAPLDQPTRALDIGTGASTPILSTFLAL